MAIAAVQDSGGGIPQSWITSLTETSSTQKEAHLGAIRREGKNVYKYVKYIQGAETITQGAVLAYLDYAANTVTGDVSTTATIGAGVLVGTPADDDYCWIQIKGEAGIEIDATGNAGQALWMGTVDNSMLVVSAFTQHACAVLIVATPGAQRIVCDFPF